MFKASVRTSVNKIWLLRLNREVCAILSQYENYTTEKPSKSWIISIWDIALYLSSGTRSQTDRQQISSEVVSQLSHLSGSVPAAVLVFHTVKSICEFKFPLILLYVVPIWQSCSWTFIRVRVPHQNLLFALNLSPCKQLASKWRAVPLCKNRFIDIWPSFFKVNYFVECAYCQPDW